MDNLVRSVDLPWLPTVRPKSALSPAEAEALLGALPPLARTVAGLALLTGGGPSRTRTCELLVRSRDAADRPPTTDDDQDPTNNDLEAND